MREKFIQVVENMGICLLDVYEHEDIDLREYVVDSIQFISLIVSVEKAFGFQFPDELLLYDNLKSFNAFVDIIENCCLEQQLLR